MKKFLMLVSILTSIATITPVFAQNALNRSNVDNINYVVKGIEYVKTENEHIFIPLRKPLELLGFQVEWVNDLQQINLKKEGNGVCLKVDEDDYKINYVSKQLGETPLLINETAYVPVELFSDLLNYKYKLNENGTIDLMSTKENQCKLNNGEFINNSIRRVNRFTTKKLNNIETLNLNKKVNKEIR